MGPSFAEGGVGDKTLINGQATLPKVPPNPKQAISDNLCLCLDFCLVKY